jgi:TatD DNase family protein
VSVEERQSDPQHSRGRRPPAPEPLAEPGTIDAHTHLDACGAVRPEEVRAAMDRAAAVGVRAAVTVADDLASARWVLTAAEADARVSAAVALHPTRANTATDAARAEIATLAGAPSVVAVGETGLDYYWPEHDPDCADPATQREVFAWHIELAKLLDKPLMIHDRDAHDDVLAVLRTEGAPERVIFHCFSGGPELARACADAGYYTSFAGPVTFRNAAALREAAVLLPEELLLVETDAPFLTPHPHRGKANEPYCLPWTVRGLADARSVDAGRIAEATGRNAEQLFGIGHPR